MCWIFYLQNFVFNLKSWTQPILANVKNMNWSTLLKSNFLAKSHFKTTQPILAKLLPSKDPLQPNFLYLDQGFTHTPFMEYIIMTGISSSSILTAWFLSCWRYAIRTLHSYTSCSMLIALGFYTLVLLDSLDIYIWLTCAIYGFSEEGFEITNWRAIKITGNSEISGTVVFQLLLQGYCYELFP